MVSNLTYIVANIDSDYTAKKTNLQVKEDKTRGLYVQDATEVYVQSPDEMFQVMRSGQ